jgi:hypothetical protein
MLPGRMEELRLLNRERLLGNQNLDLQLTERHRLNAAADEFLGSYPELRRYRGLGWSGVEAANAEGDFLKNNAEMEEIAARIRGYDAEINSMVAQAVELPAEDRELFGALLKENPHLTEISQVVKSYLLGNRSMSPEHIAMIETTIGIQFLHRLNALDESGGVGFEELESLRKWIETGRLKIDRDQVAALLADAINNKGGIQMEVDHRGRIVGRTEEGEALITRSDIIYNTLMNLGVIGGTIPEPQPPAIELPPDAVEQRKPMTTVIHQEPVTEEKEEEPVTFSPATNQTVSDSIALGFIESPFLGSNRKAVINHINSLEGFDEDDKKALIASTESLLPEAEATTEVAMANQLLEEAENLLSRFGENRALARRLGRRVNLVRRAKEVYLEQGTEQTRRGLEHYISELEDYLRSKRPVK